MASTTLGSQSNKLANTASFKSLVLVSMSCSFITKHLSSVRARESKTSLKDTHTKWVQSMWNTYFSGMSPILHSVKYLSKL